MVSHLNKEQEGVVTFDCGCMVGNDGGVYCCGRHYHLVGLLHTRKHNGDPEWSAAEETDSGGPT